MRQVARVFNLTQVLPVIRPWRPLAGRAAIARRSYYLRPATVLAVLIVVGTNSICSASAILGEVRARGIDWYHSPIADVRPPDARFEPAWVAIGPDLASSIREWYCAVVLRASRERRRTRVGRKGARSTSTGWTVARDTAEARRSSIGLNGVRMESLAVLPESRTARIGRLLMTLSPPSSLAICGLWPLSHTGPAWCGLTRGGAVSVQRIKHGFTRDRRPVSFRTFRSTDSWRNSPRGYSDFRRDLVRARCSSQESGGGNSCIRPWRLIAASTLP